MQYAIFEGVRSTPIATGQRADCPGCGNEVLSKCGEINIHHWAHLSGVDCDLWSEPETPWHRDWKNRFPEEWREVFIRGDSDSWHRADVAIPGGPVIEFQHSNLNPEEIRKREDFYTQHANGIIWIVDGDEFMDRWVSMDWRNWSWSDDHTRNGYHPFHNVWMHKPNTLGIPHCPACKKFKSVRVHRALVEKKTDHIGSKPKVFKVWEDTDTLPRWASETKNAGLLEFWDKIIADNINGYGELPRSVGDGLIYSPRHGGWVFREERTTYEVEYVPHWECLEYSCHDHSTSDPCDPAVLEEMVAGGYLKTKEDYSYMYSDRGYRVGYDIEEHLSYVSLYEELPISLILPDDFTEIGPDQLKPVRWPHARKSWAYAQETIYFDHSEEGVFEWLGTVNEGGKYYESAKINTRSSLNLPKYIVGTFQSKKDFSASMKHLTVACAKAA